MSVILVFAEHEGGEFKKTAFELLAKASSLAGELGATVTAAVLGDAPAADLGQWGATKVFQVAGDFGSYSTLNTVSGLEAAIKAAGATTVIGAASFAGRDAFPRLAYRMGAGMGTEVTELRAEGGSLIGRRPMYAGKAFADVAIKSSTGFFTVRPNSFGIGDAPGGTAEIVAVTAELGGGDVQVVETRAPATDAVDLTEAEKIVSGGRSLKSKESFDSVIRPLAAAFGATAGASRAAVDAGYAPHGDQVGQTGKVVNPELYIAMGISGAIQHLAGMRTSKVIVAVNKDPDAPIFEHATYGIVDDLFEIAPLLQKEVEALS